MSRPAFIVEGQTEKLFLSNACSDSPIRTLELNGKDVEIEANREQDRDPICFVERALFSDHRCV